MPMHLNGHTAGNAGSAAILRTHMGTVLQLAWIGHPSCQADLPLCLLPQTTLMHAVYAHLAMQCTTPPPQHTLCIAPRTVLPSDSLLLNA